MDILSYVMGQKNGSTGSTGNSAVVVIDDDGTLNYTWQEIHDAMAEGKSVMIMQDTDGNTGWVSPVLCACEDTEDGSVGGYIIKFYSPHEDGITIYWAESANHTPIYD